MSEPMQPFCYNAAKAGCTVCGEEGLPCGRCRLDYYCGKAHQKRDWQRHKTGCGAVELRTDAKLGRHVVLTKDVPAGTPLLRDLPLLCIVPPWTRQWMFCVGCMREQAEMPDMFPCLLEQCPKCGWPVCGAKCSRLPAHQAECSAFQRAGFKLEKGLLQKNEQLLWTALSALRTHLASSKQPKLLDLQSRHEDVLPAVGKLPTPAGLIEYVSYRCQDSAESRQTEHWPAAVRWLREKAGLSWIPEEDLVRAAGINDINAICLNALNSNGLGCCASFLYSGASMVEHQCSPTGMLIAVDSPDMTFEQVVLATKDLKKGEHLSVDYLDTPYQDAVMRRALLRRGWSFVCRCDRCEDPTSCGLHLGSPACPKCLDPAASEPRLMVAEVAGWSGESHRPAFRCQGCGQTAIVPDTSEAEAAMYLLRTRVTSNVEPGLQPFMHPSGPLHATHRIALNARIAALLVQSTQVQMGVVAYTEAKYQRFMRKVARMLDVLAAVKPGMSMHRCALLIVHYEFLVWSLEAGGPPGQDSQLEREKRIMEMQNAVGLLKPYFSTRQEMRRFVTSYMNPALRLSAEGL